MSDNIYQALNAVMQEVGYVQRSRTQGLNYSFASESAFIEALRPELVKHGVVVHPLDVRSINTESYTTRNGSEMNMTTVVVTYRFAHAPSGSHIDVTTVGQGADTGDKASNKALTGAFKYALRQALMIETGDDPDKDSSENQQRAYGQPTPRPQSNGSKPSDKQMNYFMALGRDLYGDEWDTKRPQLVKSVTGGQSTSSDDLSKDQISKLIEGMKSKLDDMQNAEPQQLFDTQEQKAVVYG